jgi:hypothetical protein
MDNPPPNAPSDPDTEADEQSEAMKNQLRNDVMSWKAARSDGVGKETEVARPAAKPPARRAAVKSGAAAPTRRTAEPVDDKKKPFGMSYDGMSQADYITYMMSRGRR